MTFTDKDDLISTMRRFKICVLIPTYNNAGSLGHVIDDVLNFSSDVIVVNDGSTDSTLEVLDQFKDSIHILSYTQNRGKGHALKQGFKRAIDLGYKYAITIDSDGQHYPEDIPLFVEAIACNYGALIVGERDLSNVDINGKSSFANKFSNFWFNLQTGKRLRDTQTGYRAYPLFSIHGLSCLTSRYEAELELLVFAAWHDVPIISIPIRVYYPPQEQRVSHFRPALDFTRISILNTILCILAIIYGLPLRIFYAFAHRKLFAREVKLFTHCKGVKREDAVTIERFLRSIYAFLYFIFWSLLIFTPFTHLYFAIGRRSDSKNLRFHKMLQWISGFLVRRFPRCHTRFENPSGEDFSSPVLIICNHQSHLDLPILISLHPKLIFLTNDWVWNNHIYGSIIHHAEYLPISDGIEVILPRLRELRDRGYSIVVFPEGTRSADCSILRFHQGAFFLARELNLDILPMVLHGAGFYLPKTQHLFREGNLSLHILPRVSASEIPADLPLRKMASNFRRLILDKYVAMATAAEDVRYFKSLVLYLYAYRGWHKVARCRRTLREAQKFSRLINTRGRFRKVRIINSGIGTFALLYALVNSSTEVFAYEHRREDLLFAADTPSLPSNLHFIHAPRCSMIDQNDCDLTIILDDHDHPASDDIISSSVYLPLKS
ncbi:MAG: glycosyltransferase [Lepagella sp.]